MYIVKKILISTAVSLVAGVASAIGTKAGGAIWDDYIGEKFLKRAK